MRNNLDLHQGESLTFSGVLRDEDGPVDISEATLTWRLGDADGRQTRLTLTELDGITTGDAGAWSITLDPADTSEIDPGHYRHIGKAVVGDTTYYFTQGRIRLRRDFPA